MAPKGAAPIPSGPDQVLFDSWYSSLDNLKLVRTQGWRWADATQVQPAGQS
jgi:hypothetical protein